MSVIGTTLLAAMKGRRLTKDERMRVLQLAAVGEAALIVRDAKELHRKTRGKHDRRVVKAQVLRAESAFNGLCMVVKAKEWAAKKRRRSPSTPAKGGGK